MPWLVKDEENPDNNLLFIHVPRCGGTSLTKHFGVGRKCRSAFGKWDLYHRFGMIYFFYRYKLLEKANYPFITWENLLFICEYIVAILVAVTAPIYQQNHDCEKVWCPTGISSITLFLFGGLTFLSSTFVFTAPVIGRNQFMRRAYGQFVGKLMCNFVGNNEWLTGTSHIGFLVHFTAPKMLKYELITEKDLDQADSFAIVRNPYSRMVSVYAYNKMPSESFDHFIKDWVNNKMKIYRETKSTEEWDIYCHAVPAFEYTHLNGKQIVKCIVKQEELKTLWFPGLTLQSQRHKKRLTEIPEKVSEALRGMPRTNSRKRKQPWWDYYTQETMELVYNAFAEDFEYFGYDIGLPNRPDLTPPKNKFQQRPIGMAPFSSNLDFTIYKDDDLKRIAKEKPENRGQSFFPEVLAEERANSDLEDLERAESGQLSRKDEDDTDDDEEGNGDVSMQAPVGDEDSTEKQSSARPVVALEAHKSEESIDDENRELLDTSISKT